MTVTMLVDTMYLHMLNALSAKVLHLVNGMTRVLLSVCDRNLYRVATGGVSSLHR